MTNYERIHNMLPTELAETIELIVHEAATHPKTFDGIRKKDILNWLGQNKGWIGAEDTEEEDK